MYPRAIGIVFRNALLIAVGALAANQTQAATVNADVDPEAQLQAGVRYRHMNGMGMGQPRVHLGTYPLPTSGLPNATSISWGSGKHVLFTYNATTGTLSTTVGTGSGAVTFNRAVSGLTTLNYIQIIVQRNQMMGGGMGGGMMHGPIDFNNVQLNGHLLSPSNFSGAPSGARWNVTGEDLTNGFTMEGDIVLSGMQPGMDMNHVEILVGYTDQTGPEVKGLNVQPNPAILNGSTTLRATVSDADRGGNTIAKAEYSLNGGAWLGLTAQDGTFDAVSEDVEAQLPATQLGENTACVRGTDSKGNVTEPPTVPPSW